jgi:hypothetical protein
MAHITDEKGRFHRSDIATAVDGVRVVHSQNVSVEAGTRMPEARPMDESKLRISTPNDLVAAVPYLLGFTPTDSLVVIGLRQRRAVFQVRLDLPDEAECRAMADYIGAVVARQGVSGALIVGYGSETAVRPAIEEVAATLDSRSIVVQEKLRVDAGRYWSYVCANPDCCAPDGTPIDDIGSSRVAAEATYFGLTTSASRDAIVARLAPVSGEEAVEVTAAAAGAEGRFARMMAAEQGADGAAVAVVAGMLAVDEALARVAGGELLSTDEVAWLALLLVNISVRDYVWDQVGLDLGTHVAVWSEVLRRCDPNLAAAPGTLLAFAAWRNGEGAVSSIALERALDADPNYSMARLLLHAIEGGMSPREYERLMAELERSPSGRSRRRTSNGRHSSRRRRQTTRSGRV